MEAGWLGSSGTIDSLREVGFQGRRVWTEGNHRPAAGLKKLVWTFFS